MDDDPSRSPSRPRWAGRQEGVPSGRFAVTRFKGLPRITDNWQEFVRWFEESGLEPGGDWQQCYEEMLNPGKQSPDEWEFELYLPVAAG